ncbi:MAG: cyclic pyranopterin monophosphate synthase MoaC [Euryarchaeota archaeon]|nr:cyclic pyranopterin monophosphate synthase MoaC [Euryarchaeota archaeon]
MEFTHIKNGMAQQVDISNKPVALRRALAEGTIALKPETISAIKQGSIEKGNVLNTATVAAVLATKQTSQIIPLCHPIPLTSIQVNYSLGDSTIKAIVEVKSEGQTGVEMEAITGVSVALLTIWDMVKSVEKDETGNYPVTKIQDIRVLEKIKIVK